MLIKRAPAEGIIWTGLWATLSRLLPIICLPVQLTSESQAGTSAEDARGQSWCGRDRCPFCPAAEQWQAQFPKVLLLCICHFPCWPHSWQRWEAPSQLQPFCFEAEKIPATEMPGDNTVVTSFQAGWFKTPCGLSTLKSSHRPIQRSAAQTYSVIKWNDT